MANLKRILRWTTRYSRRAAVTIGGFVVVVVGIILLPLPGPGMLVILGGLAILGTEYDWAKRALGWSKKQALDARDRIRRKPTAPDEPGSGP